LLAGCRQAAPRRRPPGDRAGRARTRCQGRATRSRRRPRPTASACGPGPACRHADVPRDPQAVACRNPSSWPISRGCSPAAGRSKACPVTFAESVQETLRSGKDARTGGWPALRWRACPRGDDPTSTPRRGASSAISQTFRMR
jgi:hypothetical protein